MSGASNDCNPVHSQPENTGVATRAGAWQATAALLVLAGVGLMMALPTGVGSSSSVRTQAAVVPDAVRLSINTATEAQFTLLPGIGEKRAQAIVRLREDIGRFRSIRQLERVKGIGPKTVEAISPYVAIDN